jgi:hypothetical protein
LGNSQSIPKLAKTQGDVHPIRKLGGRHRAYLLLRPFLWSEKLSEQITVSGRDHADFDLHVRDSFVSVVGDGVQS